MKVLLNLLIVCFLMTGLNIAQASEDPPLPWGLCEMTEESVYGIWEARNSEEEVIFYVQIDFKTRQDDGYEIIRVYQYDLLLRKISEGYGWLAVNKKVFYAGMNTVSRQPYTMNLKTYCDEKTGQKYTILQVEYYNGIESRVLAFSLERVKEFVKDESPEQRYFIIKR